MREPTFAILISTRNRINDLTVTLNSLKTLYPNPNLECVVFDDGSTDGTATYVELHFPWVKLLRNEHSQGYLFCRNKMLNSTQADFAISLDDDANFVSANPLAVISEYFNLNADCGVIGFRIFWGLQLPDELNSSQIPHRVNGFVGCGHAWRMDDWRKIPNYPEWFVFYGEEEFASKSLFQKNRTVHYLPAVLVHHRVDVKARRNNSDYTKRLHSSLRAGWFLFLLFDPVVVIPRKLAYSIGMQVKLKVVKGDMRAAKAIIWALISVLFALPKIIRNRNAFTRNDYQRYKSIAPAKIYWHPESEYR